MGVVRGTRRRRGLDREAALLKVRGDSRRFYLSDAGQDHEGAAQLIRYPAPRAPGMDLVHPDLHRLPGNGAGDVPRLVPEPARAAREHPRPSPEFRHRAPHGHGRISALRPPGGAGLGRGRRRILVEARYTVGLTNVVDQTYADPSKNGNFLLMAGVGF